MKLLHLLLFAVSTNLSLAVEGAAVPDFSKGMPGVTFVKKEEFNGTETFHLRTALSPKEFSDQLGKALGAGWTGWTNRVLTNEEMALAANKARMMNAEAKLSVYKHAKLPGVDIRVTQFKHKAENKGSSIEIAVIRPDQESGIDLEATKKRAEQGDAESQYILANIMGIQGKHASQADKEAFIKKAGHWLRKAAGQGYADAQHQLGAMYEHGSGVEKDQKQAADWFLKAANQGHNEAQCRLGLMYAQGRGVEENHKQAAHWYRKSALHPRQSDGGSAKSTSAYAQNELGMLYATGKGVLQDDVEAYAWLITAASNDIPDGLNFVGKHPERFQPLRTQAQARSKDIKKEIGQQIEETNRP